MSDIRPTCVTLDPASQDGPPDPNFDSHMFAGQFCVCGPSSTETTQVPIAFPKEWGVEFEDARGSGRVYVCVMGEGRLSYCLDGAPQSEFKQMAFTEGWR